MAPRKRAVRRAQRCLWLAARQKAQSRPAYVILSDRILLEMPDGGKPIMLPRTWRLYTGVGKRSSSSIRKNFSIYQRAPEGG